MKKRLLLTYLVVFVMMITSVVFAEDQTFPFAGAVKAKKVNI